MQRVPGTTERPTRRRVGARLAPLVRARLGRWVPLALLLLSLGVAAAAVLQGQREARSHRATAARLIRDHGAFAAWSFRQHTAEALRASLREHLEPAVHAQPGRPAGTVTPAQLVALARASAEAPVDPAAGAPLAVRYYYRVPIDGGVPAFAGEVPSADVQRWIAGTLRAHVRRVARPPGEFRGVVGTVGGVERVLLYALAQAPGGARVAYGFELDSAGAAPLLGDLLAREALLPASIGGGRRNTELLTVALRLPGGRVLFASGPDAPGAEASRDRLGPEFGELTAHAAVRPEAAALVGGAPARPQSPLLAGLLLLACGLGVVAVRQLRREGELARLRSDFVSSVSHELRTPLAQVQLFLETLRHGRYRTDAQREWILDNIERETTRLTSLVDNVLHFSRAERGGTGGTREPVALAPYLEALLRDFAPLAASRKVRFATAFEPGLVASLHAESFRQVVLNLLDNAVKYGRAGQTVRVSSAVVSGRIRLAVEDEGPGVDPRERETIWEPFRRGAHAVGSVAVGSGIGLAVVRELVAWHEGRAWVEAAAGGGARFVVELPGWRGLADADAAPATQAALAPTV
jgi:signal transduction histidine kinase